MSESMPYDQTDDETGRFVPEYDREQFVEAIEALDMPTTTEVADYVGCSSRTALVRLNELEETGRLISRMAGRTKLWAIADGDQEGDA